MAKNKKSFTVDLSLSPGLRDMLEAFHAESGMGRGDIARGALSLYLTSVGPQVALLEKRVRQLESAIGKPTAGWRREVEERLGDLENR